MVAVLLDLARIPKVKIDLRPDMQTEKHVLRCSEGCNYQASGRSAPAVGRAMSDHHFALHGVQEAI